MRRSPWAILTVLALAQFIVVLDVTIVNVALPHIQSDLGFTADGLQWVISAYTLVFGGFLLLGGRAADLLGSRRVFAGATDVNAALVTQGAAWAYRDYLTDASLLTREAEARTAARGLWSLPLFDRSPPWEWRHGLREAATARPVPLPASPRPVLTPMAASGRRSCDSRRYCRQMLSCADAVFHLRQCGVASLDGDGDGVPCEALCRAR